MMRRDKTGIILMAHREKKPACMRESLSISHTSHFLPAFLPIAEAKTNKKRATPKPATAISVDAIFRSDRVNPGILAGTMQLKGATDWQVIGIDEKEPIGGQRSASPIGGGRI
jgi:hypothetical protein